MGPLTWSQFSMLHAQHKASSFRPPEQASDIAQPTAKADPTHLHPSALTLRALYKLIGRVGALPAQHSPQACPTAHITWYDTCADALSAFVFSIGTCAAQIKLSQIQLTHILTTSTQVAGSARSKHMPCKQVLCRIYTFYSISHSCNDSTQHDNHVEDARCSVVVTLFCTGQH